VSKPASDPSIPSTPSQPTEPSEPFITGENSAVLMVIGIVCISVLGMMLFWRKKSKDSE
jgi:LPXTG-motif cell wall-anchored protein